MLAATSVFGHRLVRKGKGVIEAPTAMFYEQRQPGRMLYSQKQDYGIQQQQLKAHCNHLD